MATTKNTTASRAVRRRMLGLSLHAWENVVALSLGIAAFAAAIVGVSTYVVIQLTREANRESAGQIAALATQGDQLRKDTAEANARAAEAARRAAVANLELAKFRAPRSLSDGTSEGIQRARQFWFDLREFAGTKWDAATVPYDLEIELLLRQLENTLRRADWQQIDWKGQSLATNRWSEAKKIGVFDGANVSITVSSLKDEKLRRAAEKLATSLHALGIHTGNGIMETPDIENADAVHVQIGKKM